MLNEERVRHMTHMAMMEKKKLKDYGPVTNIAKSDFLSLNSMLAFLLGTITYVAFYSAIVAILFNTLLDNINTMVFVLLLLIGILGYLMYLYIFMTRAKKRAKHNYKVGRRALNERVHDWEVLEQIYLAEEERKSPTIAMKDLQQLHQLDNFEEEEVLEDEEEEPQIEAEEAIERVENISVPESALERLMREKKENNSGE